jgi:hypothetical protein
MALFDPVCRIKYRSGQLSKCTQEQAEAILRMRSRSSLPEAPHPFFPDGHGFLFAHLPPLFFDLHGRWLKEPQRNPLGVGVQPDHRPPQGQRFITFEPQNCSYHRRPKRQHRCPVHPHPASLLTFLGHSFIPSRDQRSCSKPRSLFPLFSLSEANSPCTDVSVFQSRLLRIVTQVQEN